MSRGSTLDAIVAEQLRPGRTIYVPGVSGESSSLLHALKARAEQSDGVCYTGVHFPGINRFDFLSLHERARQRAYFMQPSLRSGLQSGRVDLLPCDYPGVFEDLSRQSIDVAFAMISPPDAAGRCSLGIACDFLPAVWKRASLRVGLVNSRLPRTCSSFEVEIADCDLICEIDDALLEFDGGEPTGTMRQHAQRVAELVQDGDTLELGVGKLQVAIIEALHAHRRLSIYSGMVSSPLATLIDSGAIEGARSVQCGVALGDARFYDRVGRDERFYFRPVSETHKLPQLAQLPSFCAINAAIEVDLFGQVNVDSVKGRLMAGVGGLPAFASGARLSPNGRSIITLPAATDDGSISRIVPHLSIGAAVAIPRQDADIVVTEHGVAQLRGASLHERAQRLIAIAAPQFRESLEAAWAKTVVSL